MGVTLTCAFAEWSPRLGDNHPMGWFTVLVYLVSALASARVALTTASDRRERVFWWGAALLLGFLAVNKQLDLQSLMTAIGRCHARLNGWYDVRGRVQLAFIVGATVVCLIGLITIAVVFRRHFVRLWPAFLGLAFVSAFVLARASSFHHVDTLIGTRLLGLRMNWLLELPGPILVLGVAVQRLRHAG